MTAREQARNKIRNAPSIQSPEGRRLREIAQADAARKQSEADFRRNEDLASSGSNKESGFLKGNLNPLGDDTRTFGEVVEGTPDDINKLSPLGQVGAKLAIGVGVGVGAFGILTALGIIGGGAVAYTAVSKLGRVGTTGKPLANWQKATTAGLIATNPATTAATQTMLGGIAGNVGMNAVTTTAVVGGVMTAVGTYPFAGFIEEEALQTIGFALTAAIKNGDEQGIEEAIAFQEAMLNPDLWEGIKEKIPMLNVLAKLDKFTGAAKIKFEIDKRFIANEKEAGTFGMSQAEKRAMVESQENADFLAVTEKRLKLEAKYFQLESDAREQSMINQARFWANERKKQAAIEKKEREEIANFWFEYKKRVFELEQQQEGNSNRTRSKLGFGIV